MTEPLGSSENPLRVAVVGSGPSGMYAVASLIGGEVSVVVDVFDRLPAPFGLVRYGVAPDHPKIKRVSSVFHRILQYEGVRYFGNVEVGIDISRAELKDHYHQIVYAVGAQSDRRLGIAGEELDGSWSSTEFVNWYNGHPDQADSSYPLDCREVAVVGIGNVAMDVARILAAPTEVLAKTDISDAALEVLRSSQVETVHLLARRGPVQAKCSPSELKELGEVSGVSVRVGASELSLDSASQSALDRDRTATKNLELLRGFVAATEPTEGGRTVQLHFLASPTGIVAGEDGAVAGLRFERNELILEDGGYLAARGTGEFQELPVGRVIRAIGYRSEVFLDLPYNDRRGVIPNALGRIQEAKGEPLVGEYVVGWVKRGPTGLIGSNKVDARETVAAMFEDQSSRVLLNPSSDGVDRLLADRGVRSVSYEEWLKIEAVEEDRGQAEGRPRKKFLTVDSMLETLGLA